MLDEAAREVPDKTWTANVLQFLRGQIDAKTILSRAKDDGQRTEAHGYVGFLASLDGRVEEALVHLRWVAAHGARKYAEYEMARREIARLTRVPEARRE
jgi:lipoprotein NlpI